MVTVREYSFRSRLEASAEEVWAHAISPEGINAELWPWVRMTFPSDVRELSEDTVVLGRRLFRSWVLFLGVIPVDYDDITLVELEPGRRFLERSVMWSQRSWEHERVVEALEGGGCEVVDRLRFEPRFRVLGGMFGGCVRWIFGSRHRTLRRRFA